MKGIKNFFAEIGRYPTAIFGTAIIAALVAFAIYIIIAMPYEEAITLWRGGENEVYKNPRYAQPAWVNWFRQDKLVESFDLNPEDTDQVVRVVDQREESAIITDTYTFDFEYDTYPQDLALYFDATFDQKQPFVSMRWITPDEREIRVGDFAVGAEQTYRFTQDEKLKKRLDGIDANEALFMDEEGNPLHGTYQLVIDTVTFEPESDISGELVVYGEVFGFAGTDHLRRDLSVSLQWGVPIALAFGLLAALGTSLLTMTIAAIGTWYGGIVDSIIQRITEVNMVLPFLSILIMVGTFYSRSIWVILGVTILLSIFTGAIKTYRSMFMQVKNSTYIEAAKAYGASDFRIIFHYLIPRMIPLLIPGLVSSVPQFVFLEASLAVLGLGDPVLPTWGKTINDAWQNGALYKGYYYWILEPAVLLMITGLGFAMLGFALDRIFNPRLRGV